MAKATTITAAAPPPGKKLWLPVFRPQKVKLAATPTFDLTPSKLPTTILSTTPTKRLSPKEVQSNEGEWCKRAKVEDSGYKSVTKSADRVGEQGQGTPTKSTGQVPSLDSNLIFTSPSIESGSSEPECVPSSPSIESGSSPSSASLRHSSSPPSPQLSSSPSPPNSRYARGPAPKFTLHVHTDSSLEPGVKKERTTGRRKPAVRHRPRPVALVRAQTAKPAPIKPTVKLEKCRTAVSTKSPIPANTWDPIDNVTLAAFADDKKSCSIPHIQLDDYSPHSSVRLGEVRVIAQAPADEVTLSEQEAKPWYGVVKNIRGLVCDKQSGRNRATGNPAASYLNVYVQIAFLYTKADFEMLPKTSPHYRWKDALISLGDHERVETDHTMWIRLGRVGERQVSAFRFHDRYPAAPVPGTDDAFARATHPLAHLSQPLPSQVLPDYLFGGESDSQASAGHASKAPYVRASFGFGDMIVKKENEAGAIEPKLKGVKRARGKTKWTRLGLTAHYNDQPYDPATVQHFSPALQQWCNVADLKSRKQKRKPAPVKYTKVDEEGMSAGDRNDSILAALNSLAEQNIVRGGAFGLTGNAFLVTRAIEIKDKLVELDGQKTRKSRVDALMVEVEGLVVSATEWAAEVKRRKGEGMEAGDASKGEVWVCPSDGKTEI